MGKEKIPVSEHQNIIEMYTNGMPQPQIAEKYNVGRTTITYILCKYDVHRKDRKTAFDIHKDEMRRMYEGGFTVLEIADKYHVCEESLRKKLNAWGVSMRHSLYTANDYYFDTIDHQDKAYIMGIWWADGYNNVSRNTILMSLQEGDKDILDKINLAIENTNPLNYLRNNDINPRWQNAYRMAVTSPHMSKTLESYGMVQAKSLVVKFPTCLPEHLYPHFIRGLLDGDGCILKRNYRVDIMGTAMLLEQIQRWCADVLGVESHLSHPKDHHEVTYVLTIWKKSDIKVFLDAIYKDANLYLQRKYDIYISKYCSEENINNISVDVANQQSNETEKTLNLSA